MYDTEKTPELYQHCKRIGVEPELYLELIHKKYNTEKEYREHISELEQIAKDFDGSD